MVSPAEIGSWFRKINLRRKKRPESVIFHYKRVYLMCLKGYNQPHDGY